MKKHREISREQKRQWGWGKGLVSSLRQGCVCVGPGEWGAHPGGDTLDSRGGIVRDQGPAGKKGRERCRVQVETPRLTSPMCQRRLEGTVDGVAVCECNSSC